MSSVFLDVTELKTGKVVHSVEVRDASERKVEQVLRGMLINMDRERFVVGERRATPKHQESGE